MSDVSVKNGLWMYCIIENRGKMEWDCFGIHGTSRVYTVADESFAAVVSEEPMKKYPLVRDFLIAHQRVSEKVMQTHPVLPVRFCTVAENQERIIKEVLRPKAEEFRKSFARITHKEEYGLRIRWKDLNQVFRELGETDEIILKKKKLLFSLSEEQKRAELIEIGHLVQQAIQEKNEIMAKVFMESLTPIAAEAKQNKVLGDAMVLNAAFLIEREKQEAFDQQVEFLATRYLQLLQCKYIGPIPPFNFVEIAIRWERESNQLEETPSVAEKEASSDSTAQGSNVGLL